VPTTTTPTGRLPPLPGSGSINPHSADALDSRGIHFGDADVSRERGDLRTCSPIENDGSVPLRPAMHRIEFIFHS
jgi:hypothetical protein